MPSAMNQRNKSLVARAISGHLETESKFNNPQYLAPRAESYFNRALEKYEEGRLPIACLLFELAIVDYKRIGLTAKVEEAQDWLTLAKKRLLIN